MRKLFKMALAAMMCFSMVACSNGNQGNGNKDPESTFNFPETPQTISIWHTFTGDQLTTLEAIAAAFTASNEWGITVKVESQAYNGFLDSVKSAVYNGVGPDIIINYASAAAQYVADEKVADLGAMIADPKIGIPNYKDSLPEGIYNESIGFEDGKQHIMITQTTGPIIFYNKTIYDSLGLTAPTTWAQLAENSKKIKEEKNKTGFAFDSLTDTMQALIMQSGSGYIDTAKKEVLWNNEKVVEKLTYMADNTKAGYFAVNPTNNYFSDDMNAQLVAAYIGSVAGLPYIKYEDAGFELGCAPIPLEGNGWNSAWDRGAIVFDYDNQDKTVASYLFVKYFVETENSLKWNMAMNALSPYFSVNEIPEYKTYVESNIALNALSQQMETASVLPSITGSDTVRTELESAVRSACDESAKISPADALAEAAENSNKALKD